MSVYGQEFDAIANRWAVIENEHDKIHPDRNACGGVGGCTMMCAAVDLKHEMVEALDEWRLTLPQPGKIRPAVDQQGATPSQIAARLALSTLRADLDEWIETSKQNHEANGHRGEPVGGECWRQWDPSDIRRMINDTARDLGLSEFPAPVVAKEDE